jgi:PilZ domain
LGFSGQNAGPAGRKESRVPAVVPVRIYGMDAEGKPFGENVATLNISRHGVMLSKVETNLNLGDVIGVQKGVYKAKFRVRWLGKKGSSSQGQVGLECMEPTRNIFGMQSVPDISEVHEQQGILHRTRSGEGEQGERRATARYRCDIGVQVRVDGDKTNLWSKCTDISEGGCYVEARSPIPVGAKLTVVFFLDPENLVAPAVVRSAFPGMGIGLQFQFSATDHSERMRRFIEGRFASAGPPRSAVLIPRAPFSGSANSVITIPAPAPSAPSYPALELLEGYLAGTLAWAESAGLGPEEREELEQLADSLRNQLKTLRNDLQERIAKQMQAVR